MSELLTAAQMRAIEAEAIASGRVTGAELMERAGRGVVEAIFEEWPELAATSHKAVVLCGPGNNGGDGFVVARLLKAWGWEVEVFLYGDPDKLPPDARVNYERWGEMGNIHDAAKFHHFETDFEPHLEIDALFGIGLSRPIEDPVLWERLWSFEDCGTAWALREIGRGGPRVPPRTVSIDIPSGLDADSGRPIGVAKHGSSCARAILTVTFHAPKRGHFLAEGPEICGKTVVVPIGLQSNSVQSSKRAPSDAACAGDAGRAGDLRTHLCGAPLPGSVEKGVPNHKYGHGHALILSGPMGRSGAARLAARAALRVGAGLVTVAAPGSAMMECATHLTAIMVRKCDGAERLEALLEDKRLNALCLGPGLGVGEGTRALVAAALTDPKRPVVLDADALTSFTDNPDDLFALLHTNVVLTPHAGEFARLFPDIFEDLSAPATKGPAYSKVDATRAAAARAGCAVLFKGADTVIAEPSGRCAINAAVYDRAAPWLATAGSGDVLAGVITGLMARGLPPMQAAETGAWLHVEAARAFGPGLIAEDLPELLPRVFRDLGL